MHIAQPFTTFGTWHTIELMILKVTVIKILQEMTDSTQPTVQIVSFEKLSAFVFQHHPSHIYTHSQTAGLTSCYLSNDSNKPFRRVISRIVYHV